MDDFNNHPNMDDFIWKFSSIFWILTIPGKITKCHSSLIPSCFSGLTQDCLAFHSKLDINQLHFISCTLVL